MDSFLFLFLLIAVVRTSKTMLNKSGESGHPCLLPDLQGNVFSFSPMSMIFFNFIYLFIWAVLGLSCGMWDLR